MARDVLMERRVAQARTLQARLQAARAQAGAARCVRVPRRAHTQSPRRTHARSSSGGGDESGANAEETGEATQPVASAADILHQPRCLGSSRCLSR